MLTLDMICKVLAFLFLAVHKLPSAIDGSTKNLEILMYIMQQLPSTCRYSGEFD